MIPKDPSTKTETTLDYPYQFIWQGNGLSHNFFPEMEIVQTSSYNEQNMIKKIEVNFWNNYGQTWNPPWR